MKNVIISFILFLVGVAAHSLPAAAGGDGFVRIQGKELVTPDGERLFIRGTNLGNWLNPEGYMFGFSKTNSPAHDPMKCSVSLSGEECHSRFSGKDFKG